MENFYNGKNVLILGGAGFIGSNLAIALVRLGAHVTIIDNLNKLYGGNLYNLSEISNSIEFIKDDIRNHGLLKDCLKKKQVATTIFNVSRVFKNRSAAAVVPAPLLKYLKGQASKAAYPLTSSENTWTLKGKLTARLRKAGPYWVALERAPTGLYVNLFTDKFKPGPAKGK